MGRGRESMTLRDIKNKITELVGWSKKQKKKRGCVCFYKRWECDSSKSVKLSISYETLLSPLTEVVRPPRFEE